MHAATAFHGATADASTCSYLVFHTDHFPRPTRVFSCSIRLSIRARHRLSNTRCSRRKFRKSPREELSRRTWTAWDNEWNESWVRIRCTTKCSCWGEGRGRRHTRVISSSARGETSGENEYEDECKEDLMCYDLYVSWFNVLLFIKFITISWILVVQGSIK